MVVYPVKWLPYMFILGGIYVLVAEEDFFTALILVGVGAAWLFIKKKYFSKKDNAQNVNTNVNYSSKTTMSTQNFCTNCGSKIQQGDQFCQNCGNKLNR